MASLPAIDFKPVFETIPGLYLILAPDLTIAAASNVFLEALSMERNSIVGHRLPEIFPDTDNADDSGSARYSVNQVLQHGRPHQMAMRRYDVSNKNGGFTETYWQILNTPVFNEQQQVVQIIHSMVDVTAREQEINKLKATANDDRLLVNAIKDYAIFMVGLDGSVASWNSGAERIKGYTASEIIGRSIEIFYTPEDLRNGVPQSNLRVAAQNGHFETEGWRVRKDGTLFWANIVITALKNDKDQLYGFSKITRDITESKKARDEVEFLSLLINRSNDAIYTVDADFKIRSWNRGAEKLYGFSEEEVLGKNSNTVLNTAISQEEINSILHKITENEYWNGELKRKTKDGRVIWVQSSNTIIKNSFGIVVGYISVSADITEQKRLKEQVNHLANIAEYSSEAIISRGIDQRMISWNKGAEVLFGFSKEEVLGKPVKELGFIRFSDAEIAEIEEQLIKKGKWQAEKQFYHKNGSSFYGLVTANGIRNEQGEITSLVFIIKDISLRKQLEEQLKRSNEVLEEKVRERTDELYKSERRFRALIENSNDIITLMDSSYKLIYRSPAATRVLGWTDEDMIGVVGTKNIHVEDRPYAESVINEIKATPAKMSSIRFRMQHKNGHYLWLEGTLSNLLEDKYVRAIVFNFRDITERVEAEEKLKASEKQFRTTFDNMLEGIQIIDFNWRYMYVNKALIRYSRKPADELVGYTIMEAYPGVEQTDLYKILGRTMKDRVSQMLENEFVFPDGSRSDFQLSIQPHPEGILILSVDITDIKKVEKALKTEQEKFSRIATASPGLIYSFSLSQEGKMSFAYASKAFESIFGVPYESASVNAERIIDNFLEVDKEKLLSSIDSSARNMSPWQLQFRYNHPVKGLVWLEGHSIPTSVADGSILWHGVITDVTERKLSEDKINEQNLRLKTISDNLPGMMLYQLAVDDYGSRKLSYVSNGVTQLTGRSPEEVLNNPALFFNMVLGEDAPKMLAAETASYKNMSAFNIELRCLDFKGEMHWLNVISTPRKLHNNQVVWDGFHLDITERKRIQEQLKEREEQLRLFIEHSPASLAMFDRDMKYIAASRRWINDYKLEGQVITGKVHYEIFPEITQHWKDIHQRCLDGAVEKNDDDFFLRSDGTPIWLRWEIRPWSKASGEIGGIIIFTEDISEKKLAEQQKEFDSNNLKALINNTHDLMWSVDRNYKLITSNEAFDKVVRSISGQSIIKGASTLISGFSDKQLERYKTYYDRAFTGESFTEVEYDDARGDFWSEISFYPIFERGVVAGTACFSRNITEKKRAEQELKRNFEEKRALAKRLSIILNTLPANIALLDGRGVIVDVNEAWKNFADENGFTGNNYCIGNNYLEISKNASGKDKEDGKKVALGIQAVLRGRTHEFVYEYPCHTAELQRWFRMVVTPLHEKEYAGAVVMHVDISELRRLEQERLMNKIEEQKKITKAMLVGQEKERNHLGQELHDNINQILAGTRMFLSVAAGKSKEVKELIRYPMELLDTSMSEIRTLCHQMVTPLKNVDLEELIRTILGKLSQATGIHTTLAYAVAQGRLSDELRINIYRIIQELVTNIHKYAEAEMVDISLKTDDKTITIIVADDGKGFDTTKKRKGVGISNMMNRVESFNGELKIESSAGSGCRTTIIIPY